MRFLEYRTRLVVRVFVAGHITVRVCRHCDSPTRSRCNCCDLFAALDSMSHRVVAARVIQADRRHNLNRAKRLSIAPKIKMDCSKRFRIQMLRRSAHGTRMAQSQLWGSSRCGNLCAHDTREAPGKLCCSACLRQDNRNFASPPVSLAYGAEALTCRVTHPGGKPSRGKERGF